MIEIHTSKDRGHADHGWLKTFHSFSFANWHNPRRMGFGKLRVLNDDIVAPGRGFGLHPHDNMEIVTIVLSGAVEHRDSSGGHGIIKAGEVQHMSAGLGVRHSEMNASKSEPVHLLQIWVEPKEQDITPTYDQKSFSNEQRKNTLLPIVLGKKSRDALYMHQSGGFYWGLLDSGKEVMHKITGKNHCAYVFVITGEIKIEKYTIGEGDAAAISGLKSFTITAKKSSDILLIEVPIE